MIVAVIVLLLVAIVAIDIYSRYREVQYTSPRNFTLFFHGSVSDPAWLFPMIENLPGNRLQVRHRGFGARLLVRLVSLLVPRNDWDAIPIAPYAPSSAMNVQMVGRGTRLEEYRNEGFNPRMPTWL